MRLRTVQSSPERSLEPASNQGLERVPLSPALEFLGIGMLLALLLFS